MAVAAKKRDAVTEQNSEEAAKKLGAALQVFQDMAEVERKKKVAEAMAGPVVSPSEVLVRDPETGKRLVFHAVTPTQFLKIGFKLMRRAELKLVPETKRDETCIEWPQRAKVGILRACLVEPDIFSGSDHIEECPKDYNKAVKWADENLSWPTLDDILVCIYNESQPKMRMPDFRPDGEEGEAEDSR